MTGITINLADRRGAIKPMHAVNNGPAGSEVRGTSNIDLFRAVALENIIVETLLAQKAVELGLAEISAEEAASIEEAMTAEWEAALENYIAYMRTDITAESSDEDKAAARKEAEDYYAEAGYTQEILIAEEKHYVVLDRVSATMVQDAVVTDAELDAAGVGADLIRLSCGLENVQDLLEDIAQALEKV